MQKKICVCTVCKKEQHEPLPVTFDYEGEVYEFCTEKCREEFILEPDLYVSDDEESEE